MLSKKQSGGLFYLGGKMLDGNNETYTMALKLTAKYGLINGTILGAFLLGIGRSKSVASALRGAYRYLNWLEENGYLRSKRVRDSKCFELTEQGAAFVSYHHAETSKTYIPGNLDDGVLPSVAHRTFAAGILELMRRSFGDKYVSTAWSEREMRTIFGKAEALKSTKNKSTIKTEVLIEMRYAGIPDGVFGIESEFKDDENRYFEDTFLIEIERSRIWEAERMRYRLDSFMKNSRRRFAMPGQQSCRGILVVANKHNVFADYKRAIANEFPNGNIVEDLGLQPVLATGHHSTEVHKSIRIYLLNASVFEYRRGLRQQRFDTLQEDYWVPLILVAANFEKDWLKQIAGISNVFKKTISEIQQHYDPIDSALNPEAV